MSREPEARNEDVRAASDEADALPYERYETSRDGRPCFHIVGIGASAGGLEALERFFANVPRQTGMAFVVLQHLSPDFESRMDELLARQTAIPIRRVEDGMVVEPDRIYLFPPRKDMIISGGRLILKDREPERGLTLPIDQFFRSLAQDAGRYAVGVVLSGTGSDGSRGIRDIHEAGGLVITQSPETARFDGMPLSAQATGVVDVVLSPEAMPRALVRYVHEAIGRRQLAESEVVATSDGTVERIFRLLRQEYGIDFTYYKPSTVTRRIERRLNLGRLGSLDEYVAELEQDPDELRRLYHDLLIGVTGFFRDPEAFARLETELLPDLLARVDPMEEIRCWVAGCATGEEAYSLAILLHEALTAAGRVPRVKIFATDVDRVSLDVAGIGHYGEEALAEVSESRRRRYFQRDGDGYQVSPQLRQMIVFARHNVLRDAPFTRLDIVTCRNMLIYLQPMAQNKVLSLFHFGLKIGGALFLGSSETPGELASGFETLDSYWKLYRKRHDVSLPAEVRLPLPVAAPSPSPARRAKPAAAWSRPAGSQLLAIYDRLLDRHMPPSLLVDERLDLLHSFGGAERFLRVPAGRPSSNLLSLVEETLRPALAGAIQHAERERTAVRYGGLSMSDGRGGTLGLRLVVEPIQSAHAASSFFLVTFEEAEPVKDVDRPDTEVGADTVSREYIEALEAELRATRENLQATIEELETSNEELQATNEELVAANEELQSTNEELHSVNEELYTVNAEHQRKISELTELTEDMENLLQSTEVGVVFLDTDLAIRRFTSRTSEIFRLLPRDIGRSFDVFAHNIDHPHLLEDLATVLDNGQVIEREVKDHQGIFYLLRVLPYRSGSRVVGGGVVLTLIDLSSLKHAENRAKRLSAIVESSEDAIVGVDRRGRVESWNLGARELFGLTSDETVGNDVLDLIVESDTDRRLLRSAIQRACEGESAKHVEVTSRNARRQSVELSLGIFPIRDEFDAVVGASLLARDVTAQKAAEREVRQAVRQRDQFLAMLSHELRNPLSAILNAVHILDHEQSNDSLRTRAQGIVGRQTRHMARLLDDLLDVSRMRQDRIEMRKERCDLRACVSVVLESAQTFLDAAGLHLSVDLPESPLWIEADPARIQQVITNLLTNAARYTPSGRPVELSVTRDGGDAIIRVCDQGQGIPPDLLERIFEPFVRLAHLDKDAAIGNDAEEGMGLGLALVRSIVRAHGGTVVARSEGTDCGAEFEVRLPIGHVAQSGVSLGADGLTRSRREQPLVVLVEDQIDNQELLRAILEDHGYKVVAASDGPSGLQAILDHRPDMAVLDIGLPGMRGDEVARRVRKAMPDGELLMVALTGFGQQQDRNIIMESGFDHHLVKPIDVDVLLEVLDAGANRPVSD